MLNGDGLMLRPVRRSDLADLVRWFNDQEVTQYLGQYLPMTEMAEQKWIEDLATVRASTHVILMIDVLEKGEARAIGDIGLANISPKDHNATFGIAVGEKEYWSRGYGTQAARLIIKYGFEQLNLHRIASSALSFNERSLRMHKRIGFVEEGRQRQALFRNGMYHDLVMFGLLREEWKRLA